LLAVHPLDAIGEVRPGDDLPAMLRAALKAAGLIPAPFDVLVVTQKIVSKAEGRLVDLATVTPGERAKTAAARLRRDPRLVELVLAESSETVREAPHVIITRHRSGHVMANSGIDRSNIGPGDGERVLLLPKDADASAARLHSVLAHYWKTPPAVVISDSVGRPWRQGVSNVAIGAAGLPVLVDRRGELDRDKRALEVTQVALGDMIASAAGVVMGEGAEGVPAALVRGLRWHAPPQTAAALIRPLAEDLFR
jgi:coenzyme F420-0:L-glutamate ligase/coenzyme F420-1:gamma-L-glutamate ligase